MKVECSEVAAYLLTLQEYDKSKDQDSFDIQGRFAELKADPDKLINLFKDMFGHTSNRAAKEWIIKSKFKLDCELREVDLAIVRLRINKDLDPIRQELEDRFGKRPTARQVADVLKSLPESKFTGSLGKFRFSPGGPDFLKTIIVGDEGGVKWQIGDGYHRSVAFCLDGKRSVKAYTCFGV